MGEWGLIIGMVVLTMLMLSATLNLALRMPSRMGIASQLEKLGRKADLEELVERVPQYAVATATVRAATKVVLVTIVLDQFGLFSENLGWQPLLAGCLTSWLIIMLFGVAIPTAWAKYGGYWLVTRFSSVLVIVDLVCRPVTLTMGWIDPLIRRLAGVPVQDAKTYADELERKILDVVSEGEQHGAVDEEEKEMIESVIEFSETHVEEIMTPRTEMIALPKDASLEIVLDVVRTKGHSRIPVFEETIDSVLGVLYAKDLLRRDDHQPFDLIKTMRPAIFIPESKPVRDLLREFQAKKVHIAIVLDEYGGTAGLVTIEDIVEELVGEIADEYEEEPPSELQRIDDRTVEVDARMRIDEINDELKIDLPEDEDYETIGGFVFATLGKIPSAGECCEFQNVGIKVVEAEQRRITRVRLTIDATDDAASRNGST